MRLAAQDLKSQLLKEFVTPIVVRAVGARVAGARILAVAPPGMEIEASLLGMGADRPPAFQRFSDRLRWVWRRTGRSIALPSAFSVSRFATAPSLTI